MKIDIRSKLQNHEKPVLVVANDVEVEVNNDAIVTLEVMEIMNHSEDISPSDILMALRKLFSADDLEKIKTLGLDFDALTTLIAESVKTVQGASEKN